MKLSVIVKALFVQAALAAPSGGEIVPRGAAFDKCINEGASEIAATCEQSLPELHDCLEEFKDNLAVRVLPRLANVTPKSLRFDKVMKAFNVIRIPLNECADARQIDREERNKALAPFIGAWSYMISKGCPSMD
ncbi:hypothetical protein PT974_09943 [Cladobotryum mycophilum]|uniref:Uncharacterized protein n=1 Tax=Cladobotryum mycophilum TaxID=491253 RepID=A0ABR0S9L3_9HYPO